MTFFAKIYEHVISKGLGIIALAEHANRTIAGAVFFLFGRQAIFKYGASHAAYIDVRTNHLLMWEAITWLKENNFESLYLGRTDPSNKGLLRFKRAWGCAERPCAYHRYGYKREAYVEARKNPFLNYERLFQKAPLALLRLIGGVASRHVG
jgi:hypothetical protein